MPGSRSRVSKRTIKTAKYDFWLVNGQPDFGVIQGGVPGITDQDAPIRLQRGDASFGAHHIQTKHRRWVMTQQTSVPALVWKKCRQSGSIYSTEEIDKGKIWMPLSPAALLVLRYLPTLNFWSVVTLYFHEGRLDGDRLCRYIDAMAKPATPLAFTIPERPVVPVVLPKPKRR